MTKIPPPKKAAGRDALRRWHRTAHRTILFVTAEATLASVCWIIIAWCIASLVSAQMANAPLLPYFVVGSVAVIVRAGLLWHADTLGEEAGRTMVRTARREILSALATRGAGMLGSASVGARISHIQDRTQKLAGYGKNWLSGLSQAILVPVLVLIAVATQSWVSALLLFLSVGVMPLFVWLTIAGTAKAAKEQQAAIDTLSGTFQQRAGQVGLLKVFRALGREQDRIAHASQQLRIRTMIILRRAFLSTAVLEFFASVSIALVAVYIGFKLLGVFPFPTGETLTLREGMMALLLAPEFFAPLRRLSTLHHDRADGAAAAEEIGTWLESTKDMSVTRLPALSKAPSLTFSNVALSHGDKISVQRVNFSAKPDEITVLAGPSGSGKTSCLLSLLGMIHVSEGQILVEGTPLGPKESLSDSIAYMRQTPWLKEGSLGDNLRLAKPDATDDEMLAAISDAGLSSIADETILTRRVSRSGSGLSGGQRQRLALARALLRKAPILLLDEPTAHLDEEAELRFVEHLKTIRRGLTILIASHRPALIDAADTLYRLSPFNEEGETL